MFLDGLNILHVVLQACGVVLTSLFIADGWPVYNLWWIWGLFNLLPTLGESAAILSARGRWGHSNIETMKQS